MINEEELLRKARSFDRDALGEIYDRFSPGIYRYLYRMTGDACTAEDGVAETFSRFLQALKHGGGPEDHLQAYLYRIAHNWVTDYYRREPVATHPLVEEIGGEHDSTVQSAEQSIQKKMLRRALFRLTPDQRQVIVLRFLEGWEGERVAEVLEKPVGAVKSLQHRAIQCLRKLLQDEREDMHEQSTI